MASRLEVADMMVEMHKAGIEIIQNPQINHHFMNHISSGALSHHTVNGAVRATTAFGEVQVEYTVAITRAVEADVAQPEAVVSASVRIWPMDDDFESKDIFDDEWVFLGEYVHVGEHDWMYPVAKIVAGCILNVNEYAENGMNHLTSPVDW